MKSIMKHGMKKFLCVVFLLFPLLTFAKSNEENFQAGRDYLVLPPSASTLNFDPKNKISVVEFFSYGCPACYRFDPTLEKWLKTMPSTIQFQRIPVVFESDWHLYARAYYTAKILGIDHKISPDMFAGLQKEHLDLSTPERMAEFFQKRFNIKKELFLSTYNSPQVDALLSNGQKAMNDFIVFQVPGIIVDGKYKVDPSLSGNNPERLIETLEFLIKKEKKQKDL